MSRRALIPTLASIALALSACGPAQRPRIQTTQAPTIELKSISLDEGTTPLYAGVPVSSLNRLLSGRDTERLASYDIAGAAPSRGHQYLDFRNSAITLVYAENERDVEGNFAFCNDGDELFRYMTTFENGLPSTVSPSGNLTDLEGKKMRVLGDEYTISSARQTGNTTTLTLRSPQRTIELTDGDSRDRYFSFNGLKIDGEPIEDALVYIKTDALLNGNESIARLDILLTADAKLGDLYIPVNGRLSQLLDEKAGMLSDKWDLEYRGPRADGSHDIRFVEK